MWEHWVVLILWVCIIASYFYNISLSLITLGVFILAGTIGLLSFTPDVTKSGFIIAGVRTFMINGKSLLFLTAYAVVFLPDFYELILDHKENVEKRKNAK